MEFQKDELNEILNIFQQESAEIISSMDEKLLALEKDNKNKELAMHLFRDAHSLKGSARMLGFENIQNLAHKIEDVISLIKEDKLIITSKITDTISECLEFIQMLIDKTVEQKEEYVTDEIKKYIEKLEITAKEEQEHQEHIGIDVNSDHSNDKIIAIFEEIENIIINVLYIISNSRIKKDYSNIYSIEKEITHFSTLVQEIENEKFASIKNKTHNILSSIDKFRESDNKAFTFLEVNNAVVYFVE